MTALKTLRGSSSNKVLSLYTTCSSSQSRETVPSNKMRIVRCSEWMVYKPLKTIKDKGESNNLKKTNVACSPT
jgi:hypothetical protein